MIRAIVKIVNGKEDLRYKFYPMEERKKRLEVRDWKEVYGLK